MRAYRGEARTGRPGRGVGHEVAVVHHEGPRDQHVGDARGGARRVGIGGLVGDACLVEHDEVGVGAGLHATLAAHRRDRVLEHLGRKHGGASNRLHERRTLLPPEPQGAPERSGRARMGDRDGRQRPGRDVHPRGVGPQRRHAVAGDDRVGKREGAPQQGGVGRLRLVEEVGDDETAGVGGPQLAESGVVGDALARGQVRDRGRVAEALPQPLRREERGADRRRSRSVGIRLGGHAGTFGLAAPDEREHPIDVPRPTSS